MAKSGVSKLLGIRTAFEARGIDLNVLDTTVQSCLASHSNLDFSKQEYRVIRFTTGLLNHEFLEYAALKRKVANLNIHNGQRTKSAKRWETPGVVSTPMEIGPFKPVFTARELKGMPYDLYLKTDHWAAVRARAIQDADGACRLCNETRSLVVHHRTYVRRGRELPTDVVCLCAACHDHFHKWHGKIK